MNIGEKFYCSRCLEELCDEMICPFCGYDPAGISEPDVLEEGTLLNGIQYQLGAVKSRSDNCVIYGAFNYLGQHPAFIKEYYPVGLATRDVTRSDQILVLKEHMEAFEKGKKYFIAFGQKDCDMFEENGTVYLADSIQK